MRWALALGFVASGWLAGPAAARPAWLAQPHTWGKAGVSYLQYRTDAAECALAGIAAPAILKDVTTTRSGEHRYIPPPSGDHWMYSATSDLETDLSNYQADEAIQDHARLMAARDGIEACLRGRGYRMIMLTDVQTHALDGFRRGSQARQLFLYGLSVDPQVLASQTVERRAKR